MRILLVPNTYHPILGGVQTATHNLAQNLLKSGHEVQVVTNRYPRSLPAREVIDGVSIRRLLFLSTSIDTLKRGRADLFLASFYVYPSSLYRLRNLMRRFRPDVVNVHFPDHQSRFVLALRRRFKFRLVVSLHGDEIERSVTAGSLQSILRAADAVTACSQHLLDQAIRLAPAITTKAHVVHNGIDLNRFVDKNEHFHPRPYALAFGRLTHKKGFDLLLKAFAQSAAEEPDIDLIIAGEGEEQQALIQQARQLGLERRVHFRGQANPEEVVRLLNGCRFVVVPSRREPFGIVALEALAAGKPLLATRTGGLAEFLTRFGETNNPSEQSRGPGPPVLLVKPDAKDLAGGLRQICELSRNDSRARYLISDQYSWEHVARCYLNIFSA
jgi:glycosyltransferase involved in cell wall biosynthesis